MGKKRRTTHLHCPQAPHTPAHEPSAALLRLTARLPAASHQRALTFSQRLLLSGAWKKSAGLFLHFKVGVYQIRYLCFLSQSLSSVLICTNPYPSVWLCPGCEELAAQFLSQEIDGQALLLLREDHLISTMNIKLGPALKICASINTLRE